MDRLNPLDAQFVDAEDEDKHTSFAISSVAIFEGPPPSYDEFLTALAGRLPLVPRYRQKLRTIPFRLGRPVWVDDPNFDLRYHVRETALPAPGGDAQLKKLIGRVMSQRLDRDYPLWEYWLVKGLQQDRWALISKIHHCLVDGVSGTDLYRVIFDLTPAPSPPVADERSVAPEPTGLSLAVDAVAELALLPVRDARVLIDALSNPGEAVRRTSDIARGLANLARSMLPATGSSLNGPIGRQRRYTWARASLDDIKTIKRELGGTVNDVVLAAISGGFRDLLIARGEQPEAHMIRSLIPVSVRAPGEESIYENRVSALLAELPVDIADPVERLAAVSARLAALKDSKEALAGEAIVALCRYAPYLPAAVGVRLAYRLPQREIVTVTTNVPGPPMRLYAMGRKLVEIVPYVPIATSLRTGVSIFSYCDRITFGVTGDYETTPDLDILADGITRGIEELLEAARHHIQPATASPVKRAAATLSPVKRAPATLSPVKRGPAALSPVKRGPAALSPVKRGPATLSPVKRGPATVSSVKPAPARPSPAKPAPAKPAPAKPGRAKPAPAKPGRAKSAPAKAGRAKSGQAKAAKAS